MSDSPHDQQLDLTNDDQTQSTDQQQQQQSSQPADGSEDGGVDVYSTQQALAAITIRLPKRSASSVAAAAAAAATDSAAVPATATSATATLPSLHLLPCRIAHTGPANVPNYFQPTRSTAATSMLTCSPDGSLVQQANGELYDARFRGRQMTGSIVPLPATAKGFIFEEDDNRAIELDSADAADKEPAQQTIWKVSSTFDSLMLWQPDQELFERKHIRETIEDWIPIAHAIHDPFDE